jgi:hypothetical protein
MSFGGHGHVHLVSYINWELKKYVWIPNNTMHTWCIHVSIYVHNTWFFYKWKKHNAYMICPYIHVWDICKELTLELKKTSTFTITWNLLKFTQMVSFVGKLVTILYTKTNLQFNYMVFLFFLVTFNFKYGLGTKKYLLSILKKKMTKKA